MAGPAYVKVRLWNPEYLYDPDSVLDLRRPHPSGSNRQFFEIFWVGATQAAAEELGTAAASVKDGTTTPFQITVVSSSANDTNTSAGHVRKVALIGISCSSPSLDLEDLKYTVEVINLNGTTDVTSTRYYTRLIHAYACDWGSGGSDAAGNITIESPADTTLMQITATYNESDASALYFKAGSRVWFDYLDVQLADTSIAAADGIQITAVESGFEDTLNTDDELGTYYVTDICDRRLPHIYPIRPWLTERIATKASSLILKEILIANSQTYQIHAGVLASKTT